MPTTTSGSSVRASSTIQPTTARSTANESWVEIIEATALSGAPGSWRSGRALPLRQLPGAPDSAVASMISTQLSFAVERAVVGWMVELARTLDPDVVVGMPTLGLLYARAIAERLGMPNWVAL